MLRNIAVESDRTECRHDSFGLGLILDDDGNTVEWAHEGAVARKKIVEPIRFGQSVRVDVHNRIERGSFPVVGLDSIEVALDQLPAAKTPIAKRLMDVRDRRLFELECLLGHVAGPSRAYIISIPPHRNASEMAPLRELTL